MKQLMLGNQAVARGAFEAGAAVCCSYPGTPSTEITEYAAKYDEIHAQWSPNEKVALEVAFGASLGGVRSMSCMKHVGLNVAADPLFTMSYTGVNAGLVIVVADDPGMHSSQNEQDSRYYARSAHVPMLEPSDSAEALEFTKLAFEISERYDTPVLLRMTTRVSHAQGLAETGERTPSRREYVKDALKYVMMPGMAKKRHLIVESRDKQLSADADARPVNRAEYRDADIGIICSGAAYQYTREALPEASTLKLGMVYPLPYELIREFASRVDELFVAEELEPFIQDSIAAQGISVSPRRFSVQGELSAKAVAQAFGKTMGDELPEYELPDRPPVMCPGCPHRGTYFALSKIKDIHVTGDIGCYTLGALPPTSGIDSCLCMGASVGNAFGLELAGHKHNNIAVLGDSTFFHSGITGLIDMVYNGSDGLVLILDNSTTGMTGHQDNPSTGRTLKGDITNAVDIEAVCRGCGVKSVRTCDSLDWKRLRRVITEELKNEGVSVVIAKSPCALIIPKKAPMAIDSAKCTACRACMRCGCPAIGAKGSAVMINSSMCSGCGLCAGLCNFGAIKGASV